jgi:AraC-like DNA-binding protein
MNPIKKDIFHGLMIPPFHYACFTEFRGYSEESCYSVHNCFQVILGLSGVLHFEIEGEKRIIPQGPGDLFILSPGIRHRWHSEAGSVCENFMFFCDGFSEDELELGRFFNLKRRDIILNFKMEPEKSQFYIDNFRNLIQHYNSSNTNIMHGLLYAFCGLICLNAKQLNILENQEKQHPGLNRALEIIHSDFRKKRSLEDLSKQCGLGPSRLSELFRNALDMSPIQYINDLRIKKASQLLAYSDMNITEIAEYVGFSSLHYFSRFFKSHTGMTPSEMISQKS